MQVREKVTIEKIMLLDDDSINNFICQSTIKASSLKDAKVFSFDRAPDALEFLNNIKNDNEFPDLLLLDINMPIMTGWEFLENIRELPAIKEKLIKIVMLTSSIYQKDRDKMEEYPEVQAFITKPLTKDDLDAIKASFYK